MSICFNFQTITKFSISQIECRQEKKNSVAFVLIKKMIFSSFCLCVFAVCVSFVFFLFIDIFASWFIDYYYCCVWYDFSHFFICLYLYTSFLICSFIFIWFGRHGCGFSQFENIKYSIHFQCVCCSSADFNWNDINETKIIETIFEIE